MVYRDITASRRNRPENWRWPSHSPRNERQARIAEFIERDRDQLPDEHRRYGGTITLCQLSDGRSIKLRTGFNDNTQVVLRFARDGRQSLVRVMTLDNWQRKEGKGRIETFIVKDDDQIFLNVSPLPQPAKAQPQPKVDHIVSAPAAVRNWGKRVLNWWQKGGVAPEPAAKVVNSCGLVHLCNFEGLPTSLLAGKRLSGQLARISFGFDDRNRWVILEAADVHREYWLVKDKHILAHPPARSVEAVPAVENPSPQCLKSEISIENNG